MSLHGQRWNCAGHKVSGAGLEVDKAKIDVISKLPPPTNVKGIRSFLGYAGFYRCFIKDFSKIARPLTKLLEKGTENVGADHLSRIENDKTSEDDEIDDNFPDKTLMEISTKETPCLKSKPSIKLVGIWIANMSYPCGGGVKDCEGFGGLWEVNEEENDRLWGLWVLAGNSGEDIQCFKLQGVNANALNRSIGFDNPVWGLNQLLDTPMVEKCKLDEDLQGKPVDATLYRGMIGSLMYLTSRYHSTKGVDWREHPDPGCLLVPSIVYPTRNISSNSPGLEEHHPELPSHDGVRELRRCSTQEATTS
ncbi:hypothetical protein Tco_0425359 [Tanacetum coccineum]